MKVVVCGSRTVTNYKLVETVINKCIEDYGIQVTELVSGAAKGVDTLAETWALKNSVVIKRYPANWDVYGISAGPIRNRQMGDYCDVIIAIWDGKSRGTKNMIDYGKNIK